MYFLLSPTVRPSREEMHVADVQQPALTISRAGLLCVMWLLLFPRKRAFISRKHGWLLDLPSRDNGRETIDYRLRTSRWIGPSIMV